VTANLKEDAQFSGAQRASGKFMRADFDYVEGVAEAGGVPVVLPPVGGIRAAETLLERMNGLLLTGGTDLHPGYYGEDPDPKLGITIPERDAFEMALVEAALRRRMPVFGICRGMQLLNVALGGTLYQDLPSQLSGAVLKHWQKAPKWQSAHEVEVLECSWVGEVTDSRSIEVNSYHHQGIKDLAGGLVVSAHSSDGVVEAVESRDFSRWWIVGVQWHAEAMRGAAAEHQGLFEAHVFAAEHHAAHRAAA
jgi:putative glutamine amidotransferase